MIKVTIDKVELTYPDQAKGYFHTVVADENGDHLLLSKEEWENIEDTLTKQNKFNGNINQRLSQQEDAIEELYEANQHLVTKVQYLENKITHLSQQVSNISKSLRHVCLETESPIFFS